MRDDYLWATKYRPKNIESTILPKKIKDQFKDYVISGKPPNLLLVGSPGCGKTTSARAMLDELDFTYMEVNGSLNLNVDVLRNDIQNFVSSMSLNGKKKFVLIDEADYLSPQYVQPALRNFMESFSKNAGFILTCNYENRILPPLISRCSTIQFNFPKNEVPSLVSHYTKNILSILKKENIEYDSIDPILNLVMRYFPDMRKVLNELQKYSINGKIDSGILTVNDFSKEIENLIKYIKDGNFISIRKWLTENNHVTSDEIFRSFYEIMSKKIESSSVPILILILAKYQYQDAFVADKEINLAACVVEMIRDLDFK